MYVGVVRPGWDIRRGIKILDSKLFFSAELYNHSNGITVCSYFIYLYMYILSAVCGYPQIIWRFP